MDKNIYFYLEHASEMMIDQAEPKQGFVAYPTERALGSGLIDHNQKMTVAAIAIADMKV